MIISNNIYINVLCMCWLIIMVFCIIVIAKTKTLRNKQCIMLSFSISITKQSLAIANYESA